MERVVFKQVQAAARGLEEKRGALRETLLSFGAGFLLSAAELAGGVHPFGVALLCASEKQRFALLLGCLAATPFGGGRVLRVICLLGAFLALSAVEKRGAGLPRSARVRAMLSPQVSDKPAKNSVRRLIAGVCAAVMGIGGLAVLRSDPSACVLRLAASLAVLLFCEVFCRFLQKGKLYDLALLGCCFALAQTARGLFVLGAPLSLTVGAVLTLCAARSKGFAYGCVTGLLCGFASGGACMGALGVIGITYGLLAAESAGLALLLSYMIAVAGYWYLSAGVGGVGAMLLLALAGMLFLPLQGHIPLKRAPHTSPIRVQEAHLEKYAAAFSSLSGLFYTVSENAAPQSTDETVRGIRTVVDAFCRNCEGCDLDAGELCNCFVDGMRSVGVVRMQDLPLHVTRRCPSLHAMTKTVNRLPVVRERESEKGIRRMASEYANLSALLGHAAKREEAANSKDRPAATRVRNALRGMKIASDSVQVTGDRVRKVEVLGVRLRELSVSAARISAVLSEQVGVQLSEPEFLMSGEYAVMKLQSVPRVRVEYAKCTASKSGEQVCGDTVSFFETDDGLFYCLLSDGMGSGRDAALSSRLAAIMLEKLLNVGADKGEALQMVNKALLQKEQEVFATVDLLEIDRYTGVATLIKAGAAPTLLFRGGAVRRFESKTPPAGILRDVVAEQRRFSVRKGDVLLLLSDGVLQVDDPPQSFPPVQSGTAHAVAAGVLSAARTRSAGADDMSVCAIRVY